APASTVREVLVRATAPAHLRQAEGRRRQVPEGNNERSQEPLIRMETEREQNRSFTAGLNHSPSSGSVSRSFLAVGAPRASAASSTSSSVGGSGRSSPGARASSG